MSLKLNKLSVFKCNLVLSCLAVPGFAMEDPDLGTKNPLYATDRFASSSTSSSASELTYFPVARPCLFSAKEWADIEIGQAIIKDRIRQKQCVIDCLKDPETQPELKELLCQQELGAGPLISAPGSEEKFEKGIISFCAFFSRIRDVYSAADHLAQLIAGSQSHEDKIKHQNNLYYFLSFNVKHFKEYISLETLDPVIPEDSREDTFYEMIAAKLCATATKEYDVVSDYINMEQTIHERKIQIDNRRLSNHYVEKYNKLAAPFKNKESAHPVMWMHLLKDIQIRESAREQKAKIHAALEACEKKMNHLVCDIVDGINRIPLSDPTPKGIILSLYNFYGPIILQAITVFDEVTKTVKDLEEESDIWLKEIKDNKRLFRKIPQDSKLGIGQYFERQEKKARAIQRESLAIQKEAKRIADEERKAEAAAIRAKEREIEQQKNEAEAQRIAANGLLAKETASATTPQHLGGLESATTDLAKMSINTTIDEEVKKDTDTSIFASTMATLRKVDGENKTLEEGVSLPSAEPTMAPKVKIKTRPVVDPINVVTFAAEEIQKKTTPTLPAQLRTEEFKAFVEELLSERSDRKLIRLFKELQTDYRLDSETYESKNKGYFSIRCPRTNTVHVRTYHPLHAAENHFASIFMAARDVLKDVRLSPADLV